jgi:N-acyl homoserine lactone hydrolase
VESEGVYHFLAGDTSYTERLLLARTPDGVSPKADVTVNTIDRILTLAGSRPLVYLPSHDPASLDRLRAKTTLNDPATP